jgi:CHASE1-domain containing sensor protein
MGTDDIASGVRGLIDPNNPLVWFGGILLITVGAAGFASSVRLGKAKASINVGA